MLRPLSIDEWIQAVELPIIDVRSPAEFTQGHIQHANSLPLFTDEERAQIGTTYKQIGKSQAMVQGLELVGPKMADLVKQSKQIAPDNSIRVHCWRGGMRSGSVGWLLDMMGFETVHTLIGGYKSYRNWVLHQFEKKYDLVILGGRTGSAKTDVLKLLTTYSQSVIDLEGLAHHKGSAFGWIGEPKQPSQEQFENYLAEQLYASQNHSVWLEDESERIGLVRIPHSLFEHIRSAPVYFLDIPKAVRVPHLVHTYAHYGDDKLEQSILRISKRLGGLNTKIALEALHRKDYELVTDLVLTYYDKTYDSGVERRLPSSVIRIKSDTIDPSVNAELLLNCKLKSKHGIH